MLRLLSPRSPRGAIVVRALAVTGIAALLSGCASSQAARTPNPTRISASGVYTADGTHRTAIEIEDDGLPVQPPPVARRPLEPDDPSEPYSPNYGRSAAALAAAPPRMVSAAEPVEDPAAE